MTPRPDVSAERRPQILKAAGLVLARRGFDAMRMEEVAQEAGVSVGTLYWYYKGKDEMVMALMEEVIDRDLAGLQLLLESREGVWERLRRFMVDALPDAEQLLPVTYELYRLAVHDERIRLRIQSHMPAYQGILSTMLQQGMERGELRPVDPQMTATVFAALYEGVLELRMIDPVGVRSREVLEFALTVIRQGLEP